MTPLTNDLYKKIIKLTAEVKGNFKQRGLVIPVENDNGSITLDNFTIIRQPSGFYVILNRKGDPVVEQINLPQTALVVANGLALGHFLDSDLLSMDQNYGYALFDELLHERAVKLSKSKSLDYFDLMMSKWMISRAKKEHYKEGVIKSFEKLRRLV